MGVYYDAGFSAEADAVNGAPFNTLRMSSAVPYDYAASTMAVPVRYGVAANLRLPYATEWNVSLERALSARNVVEVIPVKIQIWPAFCPVHSLKRTRPVRPRAPNG